MGSLTLTDRVLVKFAVMPGATGAEVAKAMGLTEGGWSSPGKRAKEMSRRESGLMIELGDRKCSTGNKRMAATFKISQAGIEYLKSKRIPFRLAGVATAPKVAEIKQPSSKLTGRAALQAARANLA